MSGKTDHTQQSSGNIIYWNNFINNGGGVQAYDSGTTNIRNIADKNYPYDAVYANYTGNYGGDHTAPGADGDGIVDPAYLIDGGAGAEDSYSLVTLPWIFDILIFTGKNLIGIPLIQDDPSLSAVFGSNLVAGDKVYRLHQRLWRSPLGDDTHVSATYQAGYGWYGQVPDVEPIEPDVAYILEKARCSTGHTPVRDNTTYSMNEQKKPLPGALFN